MSRSTDPDMVPWIVFHKTDRARAVIVNAVAYPQAKTEGARRLALKEHEVDYSVVFPHEKADEAKARVAGSVG